MSAPINEGGPAFPRPGDPHGHPWSAQTGMTLRDWFAGQALAGDFAAQSESTGSWSSGVSDDALERRATFLYRFADAMLKARAAQ